jgi:DNA replication protein DnaC
LYLPLDEWASVPGSERLTSSLIDRFTHHFPILEMNGESYRFATSKKQQQRNAKPNTSSEKEGANL